MAHREVKINQNIRNETKRIVKGEIPLGTDTQIRHEVRESHPSILEIKRRLKGCLSIKCDFDEVLKYAKEYLGIDTDERSVKFKILDDHRRLKAKQANNKEPSIKLYKNISPAPNRDIEIASIWAENQLETLINTAKPLEKPENNNEEGVDNLSEKAETIKTFTTKKWDNIDELITVLKEEIDDAISNKQQGQ